MALTCPHFQASPGTFLPTRAGHDLHPVQDARLQPRQRRARASGLQAHGRAPRGGQGEPEGGVQGKVRHPRQVEAGAGHTGDRDPLDRDGDWEGEYKGPK